MSKKESPAATRGVEKIKPPYDNSTVTQRARLLKHFQLDPSITTLQAKEKLGILQPAARIFELRGLGHNIKTIRVFEHDSNGVEHSVGNYLYLGKESMK